MTCTVPIPDAHLADAIAIARSEARRLVRLGMRFQFEEDARQQALLSLLEATGTPSVFGAWARIVVRRRLRSWLRDQLTQGRGGGIAHVEARDDDASSSPWHEVEQRITIEQVIARYESRRRPHDGNHGVGRSWSARSQALRRIAEWSSDHARPHDWFTKEGT